MFNNCELSFEKLLLPMGDIDGLSQHGKLRSRCVLCDKTIENELV